MGRGEYDADSGTAPVKKDGLSDYSPDSPA